MDPDIIFESDQLRFVGPLTAADSKAQFKEVHSEVARHDDLSADSASAEELEVGKEVSQSFLGVKASWIGLRLFADDAPAWLNALNTTKTLTLHVPGADQTLVLSPIHAQLTSPVLGGTAVGTVGAQEITLEAKVVQVFPGHVNTDLHGNVVSTTPASEVPITRSARLHLAGMDVEEERKPEATRTEKRAVHLSAGEVRVESTTTRVLLGDGSPAHPGGAHSTRHAVSVKPTADDWVPWPNETAPEVVDLVAEVRRLKEELLALKGQ